jgi:methyl-accepting chemotaxis protein
MKLGTKIILGFAFINLIFICLVGVIYFFLRPVSVGTANLTEFALPLYTSSTTMEYDMSEQYIAWRNFIISPTNERSFVETANARHNDMLKVMAELDAKMKAPGAQVINVPEVTAPYQALRSNYNQYRELAELVVGRQDMLLENRQDLIKEYGQLIQLLTDLMDIELESAHQDIKNMADSATLTRRVELFTLVARTRSTFYESFVMLVRGLLNSNMVLFQDSLGYVANCETMITELLDKTQRNDVKEKVAEIQALMKTYAEQVKLVMDGTKASGEAGVKREEMFHNVTQAATQLGQASQKMVVSVAEESGKAITLLTFLMAIGTAVAIVVSAVLSFFISRGITGPINHLITSLSEGAEEVDSASSQLSAASDTLSSGATENAAALEQTSAALEELTSMTSRNADNANEANALMSQANQSVRKADESMVGVIRAMDEIGESGNAISKIIKTIDEIAFQTNLLALNAAVEAARAGEAGSGFAVVADEVRNLAIRSADAAKNTADLIEATINNITSGSEMVKTTADNFKTVENLAAKVAELLAEVSEASKEQTQGIGQITTAVMEMDKVTQANAASAEESASAAGHLSHQAGNLLEAVDELTELVRGISERSGGRQYEAKAVPAPKKTPALPAGRASSAPKAKTGADDDDFDF